MTKINYIKIAKKAAAIQIAELKKVNKIFNKTFIAAINVISSCRGKIIFSGQGKSGLIARKISATFSSVGIPSFFIHPSETSHGDSGAIEKKDVLIIISYSGNTSELTSILKYANRFGIKIIGCASIILVGLSYKDEKNYLSYGLNLLKKISTLTLDNYGFTKTRNIKNGYPSSCRVC